MGLQSLYAVAEAFYSFERSRKYMRFGTPLEGV